MLSEIAQVRRGSLSGLNEFYHLTPERAKELDIEPEFLKPLLKSPGESGFIPIDNKQLALRLFVCRLTTEELKKQGKTGALKYIEWGEKQVFQSGAQRGLTWPNGAEVKVRTPGWYAIPEHRSKPAQVFFASAFGQRHMHRFCLTPVIADISERHPPKGIIHHSDRGIQYASHDYVEMLLNHSFRISMARKGNPYENAAAESFIKTLKTEEVYLWEYRTLQDVQNRLPFFIEKVYNRKRLHSSLGYRPPVEFEEMFMKTQNPCPTTLTAAV